MENLKFNLYLVRHGESEGNIQNDIVGQSPNVPLTHKGVLQAKRLYTKFHSTAKYYNFDYIFTSPYKRALETAKIAMNMQNFSTDKSNISISMGTNKLILTPALREYDVGDWLCKKKSDILTDDVRRQMSYLAMNFCPPNGESQHMVERRVSEWLDKDILTNDDLKSHNKPFNVIAFSHGLAIKCLLHHIMGFDQSFTWKVQINNASITKLSFSRQGWRLHYLNDYSHLA